MGNTSKREGYMGCVTMLLNLYCETSEISFYIDKIILKSVLHALEKKVSLL